MVVSSSVSLPHDESNETLSRLLRGSIKRKGRTGELPDSSLIAWGPELFMLQRSKLYRQLSSSQQIDILRACNEFILSESYFIEKAGLGYCAKMLLAAETTEARQIYGLMASDESVHLSWLSPYIPHSIRTAPQGQFLSLVLQLIEEYDTNTLYYLVQTILEGWGVSYYKVLATSCQLKNLKKNFLAIVRDEALHHRVGTTLFDPSQLNDAGRQDILAGMKSYAEVLRLGAQNIVHCFEKVLGPLNHETLCTLFSDLKTEFSAKVKLSVLKKIMFHPALIPELERLEAEGFFLPCSSNDCAKRYRTSY